LVEKVLGAGEQVTQLGWVRDVVHIDVVLLKPGPVERRVAGYVPEHPPELPALDVSYRVRGAGVGGDTMGGRNGPPVDEFPDRRGHSPQK
jgi:hypothetical protein